MSRVDDLKAWYVEAMARRDGSWAPSPLLRAAIDELMATAEARGAHVDEHDARLVLKDEIDALVAAETQRREDEAKAVLRTLSSPAEPATIAAEQRPEWLSLVRAHRGTRKARPALIDVAERMGWNSEQPLRDLCRKLGIRRWHDVHTIVAAWPTE